MLQSNHTSRRPTLLSEMSIFDAFVSQFMTDQLLDLSCTENIAIAVSGGSDSMCLLLLLREFIHQNNFKCKMHTLTVDHKLRENSSSQASIISDFILSYCDITHMLLSWDSDVKPDSNIEKHARDFRYKMMYDYMKGHQIQHLFLGHTMDDQTENLMLRLQRGSGVSGLSGMKPISIYNPNQTPENIYKPITLVRPLLHFMKLELLQYLQEKEWIYVEDESNSDTRFARNKVRTMLNAASNADLIKQRFSLSVSNIARANDFIESYVGNFIAKHVKISFYRYATIPVSVFDEEEEVVLRVFRRVLMHIGARKEYPRLERLIRFISCFSGSDVGLKTTPSATLCGCKAVLHQDEVILYREFGKTPPPKYVRLQAGETIIWDGFYSVSATEALSVSYAPTDSGFYEEMYQCMKGIPKYIKRKVVERMPFIVPLEGDLERDKEISQAVAAMKSTSSAVSVIRLEMPHS